VLLQSATNKRASDTRERALEEREQKLLRQTDDMERDVRTSLRGATAAAAAESDAKLKEEALSRQKLITENKRLQRAADEASASGTEALRISHENAASARSEADRVMQASMLELQLKCARHEAAEKEALATSKAIEETSQAKVRAAEAEAKNNMYEQMMSQHTETAAAAAALAAANKTAEEQHVRQRRGWQHEDDVLRLSAAERSELQRNYLSLAETCKSTEQSFSAAATGLLQVAPPPATYTAPTNNESVPMRSVASPSVLLGLPRLTAAPAPLAIMDQQTPEENLTDELVAVNSQVKKSSAVLENIKMRLEVCRAQLFATGSEDDDMCRVFLSRIAVLEARISERTSRANELADALFEASC
jgi:hypothetical protein